MNEKNKKIITVNVVLEGLEEAENKVKQLVELLREANNLSTALHNRCKTEETLQSIVSTLKRIEKKFPENSMQSSDADRQISEIEGITVNLPDLATHDIQQEVKESE